jgi:hypothetical protein
MVSGVFLYFLPCTKSIDRSSPNFCTTLLVLCFYFSSSSGCHAPFFAATLTANPNLGHLSYSGGSSSGDSHSLLSLLMLSDGSAAAAATFAAALIAATDCNVHLVDSGGSSRRDYLPMLPS